MACVGLGVGLKWPEGLDSRHGAGFPAVYLWKLFRLKSTGNIGIPEKTARNTGKGGRKPYTIYTGINGITYLYTVGTPRVELPY